MIYVRTTQRYWLFRVQTVAGTETTAWWLQDTIASWFLVPQSLMIRTHYQILFVDRNWLPLITMMARQFAVSRIIYLFFIKINLYSFNNKYVFCRSNNRKYLVVMFYIILWRWILFLIDYFVRYKNKACSVAKGAFLC